MKIILLLFLAISICAGQKIICDVNTNGNISSLNFQAFSCNKVLQYGSIMKYEITNSASDILSFAVMTQERYTSFTIESDLYCVNYPSCKSTFNNLYDTMIIPKDSEYQFLIFNHNNFTTAHPKVIITVTTSKMTIKFIIIRTILLMVVRVLVIFIIMLIMFYVG